MMNPNDNSVKYILRGIYRDTDKRVNIITNTAYNNNIFILMIINLIKWQ